MFSKVILIATAGSANIVLNISQIILINDSSFPCYFRSNGSQLLKWVEFHFFLSVLLQEQLSENI